MMKCLTQRPTCRNFDQQQSELCKYCTSFCSQLQDFTTFFPSFNSRNWAHIYVLHFPWHQLADPRSFGATGSSLPERNSAWVAAGAGANSRTCRARVNHWWFKRGWTRRRGGLSKPLLRATWGVFLLVGRTNREHYRGEERRVSWARRKGGPVWLHWEGARRFKWEPSRACSSGVSQTHTMGSPG